MPEGGGERPRRDDRWLEPWVRRLRGADGTVLELGCGQGEDAASLSAAGLDVVAFDRRRQAVDTARQRAPRAALLLADLARILPFRDASFGAAVASLSMHYLPWRETLAAFAEVRRVLERDAPFLLRLNATDDLHHGAGQGEAIEVNLFRAAGGHAELKRFFDREAVVAALGTSFAVEDLVHVTIHRFELPKQTWECLARAR